MLRTMSTNRFVAAFSTALALSVLLAACDGSPTSPRGLPPPPPPGTPGTARLQLTGPATVPLGQSAQFTVTAHQSDGTTRDVTNEATWRGFNPGILSMSTPGLFTGSQKGETSISVAFAGRSAVMGNVIVVPAGTYRLTGSLRDEGQFVLDAVVEIQDEAIGITRLTAPGGTYRIYGVAGDTKVTMIRQGYETETKRQTITSHQTIDFNMVLSRPREDLSGRYTLTVTAAPECTSLPEDVRVRTYTAVVTQLGPTMSVTLEGARFYSASGTGLNRFTGVLQPGLARFQLRSTFFDYYYYFYNYPDVFEELPEGRFVALEGVVSGSVFSTGISGTLSGAIGVFTGPPFKSSARCKSEKHRFVFDR